MSNTLANYISQISLAGAVNGYVLAYNSALTAKFELVAPGGGGGSYPTYAGVTAYLVNDQAVLAATGSPDIIVLDGALKAAVDVTHNTGTGRITINTNGTYSIMAKVPVTMANYGWMYILICKNGTPIAWDKVQVYPGYIGQQTMSIMIDVDLVATDIIDLRVKAQSADGTVQSYNTASETANTVKTTLVVRRVA